MHLHRHAEAIDSPMPPPRPLPAGRASAGAATDGQAPQGAADPADPADAAPACQACAQREACAAEPLLRWELRRNCALTPRQLLRAYAALALLTAVAAGIGTALGAPLVAGFAGLELLVVAVALGVYARHALDRETVTLDGARLCVERHCGASVERAEFERCWVVVQPTAGRDPLCRLSARGRAIAVGRHVSAARRRVLIHELRAALRAPVSREA